MYALGYSLGPRWPCPESSGHARYQLLQVSVVPGMGCWIKPQPMVRCEGPTQQISSSALKCSPAPEALIGWGWADRRNWPLHLPRTHLQPKLARALARNLTPTSRCEVSSDCNRGCNGRKLRVDCTRGNVLPRQGFSQSWRSLSSVLGKWPKECMVPMNLHHTYESFTVQRERGALIWD